MAAQPEFTPGPWSTERCTLETDHGAEWCGKLLIVGPHASDSRFDEADARLISAAPDLYAALQALVRFALVALRHDVDIPGFDPETHVDIKQARAALAKAKGRDGT